MNYSSKNVKIAKSKRNRNDVFRRYFKGADSRSGQKGTVAWERRKGQSKAQF